MANKQRTKNIPTIRCLIWYTIYHPSIEGGFYTVICGYATNSVQKSCECILEEELIKNKTIDDLLGDRYVKPLVHVLVDDMRKNNIGLHELRKLPIPNDIHGRYIELPLHEDGE